MSGNFITTSDWIDNLTEDGAPDSTDKIITQKTGEDTKYQEKGSFISASRIIITPEMWQYPSSNPAVLDTDSGTNGTIKRHLFDDTTEEFLLFQFPLPSSISGTVTFEAWGYPSTWVTGKNIELRISEAHISDGQSWDSAYATHDSGDLAINTNGQDSMDRFTWTINNATLQWSANQFLRMKLSRIAPSSDNLSGDWGLVGFSITIPSA